MSKDSILDEGSVRISGATREFGLSRSKLYELMGGGLLPYFELGDGRKKMRLIPRKALREYIARHPLITSPAA